MVDSTEGSGLEYRRDGVLIAGNTRKFCRVYQDSNGSLWTPVGNGYVPARFLKIVQWGRELFTPDKRTHKSYMQEV